MRRLEYLVTPHLSLTTAPPSRSSLFVTGTHLSTYVHMRRAVQLSLFVRDLNKHDELTGFGPRELQPSVTAEQASTRFNRGGDRVTVRNLNLALAVNTAAAGDARMFSTFVREYGLQHCLLCWENFQSDGRSTSWSRPAVDNLSAALAALQIFDDCGSANDGAGSANEGGLRRRRNTELVSPPQHQQPQQQQQQQRRVYICLSSSSDDSSSDDGMHVF